MIKLGFSKQTKIVNAQKSKTQTNAISFKKYCLKFIFVQKLPYIL